MEYYFLMVVVGFLFLYYWVVVGKRKRDVMMKKHHDAIHQHFRPAIQYIDENMSKNQITSSIAAGLLISDDYLYDVKVIMGWGHQVMKTAKELHNHPGFIEEEVYGCILSSGLYVLVINTTDLTHAVCSVKRRFRMEEIIKELLDDKYIRDGEIRHHIKTYRYGEFRFA